MNFSVIGIKFVLVEFVISKFVLVEFSLCNTQLVQILHSTTPCICKKNCTLCNFYLTIIGKVSYFSDKHCFLTGLLEELWYANRDQLFLSTKTVECEILQEFSSEKQPTLPND